MFNIWNSVEMETVVSYVNKKFVVQFAETIIDDKIIQYGPAGVSKFNKALNILKNHDFEVYKTLNNELVC